MWEYFVRPTKGMLLPRVDAFGAANYTGLVAALIFLALLVTSNDASLKALGATRWRWLPGLATSALVLTLIHGVAYGRRAGHEAVVSARTVHLQLSRERPAYAHNVWPARVRSRVFQGDFTQYHLDWDGRRWSANPGTRKLADSGRLLEVGA